MPKPRTMPDDLQLAKARIIFSVTRSAGWRPISSHAHSQILNALKKREMEEATVARKPRHRGESRVIR
jgi:hypothetical protein